MKITIRSVRTIEDLATDVSEKLMFSRSELLSRLKSKETCKKYGFTPETIPAMFIPIHTISIGILQSISFSIR